MSPSIAVLGHRGWLGQSVVPKLVEAGLPTKVIVRTGSSLGQVPKGVEAVSLDWTDTASFVKALKGVDVVISLVGQAGLEGQMTLPPILAEAGVRLFIPSDYAFTHDGPDDQLVPVMKNKAVLEGELKKAGIPTLNIMAVILPNWSSTLRTIVGVDLPGNRIVYTGNTETQPINLCTKSYVAASIASILSTIPISDLAGRSIGLNELSPTGSDIQEALSRRYGSPAKIAHASDEDSVQNIKNQHPFSLMDLTKLKWSRGEHSVGDDIFDLKGYKKATLDDLIVGEQLGVYRDVPLPYNLDHYFQ